MLHMSMCVYQAATQGAIISFVNFQSSLMRDFGGHQELEYSQKGGETTKLPTHAEGVGISKYLSWV